MKSVEVVANILAEEGITETFGLMGDGNMSLITYLSAGVGLPFHTSRHEAQAVGMADGYARLTGTVGFCTVTQGPGLANAVTALITARKAGTPLVMYLGDTAAIQDGWPQDIDHRRLLEGIDVPMIDLVDPKTVHDDVRRAFALAREERRPVVINMPLDKQNLEWAPWNEDDETELPPPARPEPSAADVDAVVAMFAEAKRPVVMAGRGAYHARESMIALADATGSLLATSLPGRGLFAGEPADVGLVGSLASNLGASLVGRADLVVVFGASLNDFTTMKKTFFATNAKIVRVDLDRTDGRPNRLPVSLEVIGDADKTAKALAAAVPGGAEGYRTPDVMAQIAEFSVDAEFTDKSDDEGMDPRTLMRALESKLPASRTVLTDVGHYFGFPASYLGSEPADRFMSTIDFGAVGSGIGAAIGASIAEPDKLTVLFIGDGGLMMSLGDLETAQRESKSLLIVVMNDSAYGSELHMLREWKLDVSAAVFNPVSFTAVASALGLRTAQVDTVDDLANALADLPTADSGPLLLDCRITTHVVADWLAGAFVH